MWILFLDDGNVLCRCDASVPEILLPPSARQSDYPMAPVIAYIRGPHIGRNWYFVFFFYVFI